jgi:plasmid stabilization system protein ParE
MGSGAGTIAGADVKYAVRFRPEVPNDIADACRWYESHGSGLGERFVRELNATVSRIAIAPETYAKGEREVRSARMHRFPYVVHFRIAGTKVVILAVLHGGRDPAIWQNRT